MTWECSKERIVRTFALAIIALIAAVSLAACGSDTNNVRGVGDAKIAHFSQPRWDVINAPDGFGNLATVCDPYVDGIRHYVRTHSLSDTPPFVVQDPNCKADPSSIKEVEYVNGDPQVKEGEKP